MKPIRREGKITGLTRFLISALIVMVSMAIVAPVLAEVIDPDVEPLKADGETLFDMETAVAYALEHNPAYRRAMLAMLNSELAFVYAASIFEPTFKADLNLSETRTGGVSYESQVTAGSQSKRYEAQVSYQKLLDAGDSFALSFGTNRSENSSAFFGDEETTFRSYTSAVGLTYSRPLLRGYGTGVIMAGVDQSEIDILIAEAAEETARAELIYAVRLAYLAVAASRDAIFVAESSLEEAESIYAETVAMVDAGLFAEYQEIAANAGLASRREELLRAEKEYEKFLNNLKEVLGCGMEKEIEILPGLAVQLPPLDAEAAVATALLKRPELKQLGYQIERARIDLRRAEDSTQPELSLTGGFGIQGEDLDYTGSLNGMENFSWFAGLVYTVPLGGNDGAKSNMERAKLAIQDLELQRLSMEDAIRREVMNALVDYNSALDRFGVSMEGLRAAEAKIQADEKRFELGLITAGDLLEYWQEMTRAEYSFISAQVDVIRAAALLAKLTYTG